MVDRHGLAGRSAGAGVEVAIIGTGARVNVASSGHVRGRDLRTVVSIVLPDLLSPSRRPSWSGASGHKRRVHLTIASQTRGLSAAPSMSEPP